MTGIASVSPTDLKTRRQELKRRRQLKLLQATWRSLLATGMAWGLFWVLTQPNWVIRDPEQIDVEGNKLLSPQAVRSRLSLSYPQSLWQLEPQKLSQEIANTAPIAEAKVIRSILPPRLTIEIQERQPVAIAISADNQQILGLIDAQGIFIVQESEMSLAESQDLPKLKVIGFNSHQTWDWSAIYQAAQTANIDLDTIIFNVQNPQNLILNSDLGAIYLGPYTTRFPQQLEVLANLQELSNQVQANQIDYIDLTNPNSPTVHLHQNSSKQPTSAP
ncbi:MAG: FtsQ-type POTRA domain-containing protein [Jaaginema sp. PMC 1079.18]|nr:FtsQ-type POTRA domain-containing protein [Jaaginema sp. PMC 1080.18]MEC4849767.1 FtsQ-type POTRA domain-containing protein [Jaaginema sp. PMC 1079.18]MEC4866630.1 FtsQ-type POTRA domain-containing protein [Jaaginema sp. PMC 1078.18]